MSSRLQVLPYPDWQAAQESPAAIQSFLGTLEACKLHKSNATDMVVVRQQTDLSDRACTAHMPAGKLRVAQSQKADDGQAEKQC